MKTPIKQITLGLLSLLTGLILSACSTSSLTKAQCVNASWSSIGYQDALKGQVKSIINEHSKACGEYAIKPDLASYQQGYNRGINEFCQPLNAYLHGLKGAENKNVCHLEQREAFSHAYEQGKRIYELESQISKTRSIINDEFINHKDLKEQRELVEERLNGINISPQERAALVQRIRLISAEQHRSVNIISNNQQILKDLSNKLALAKNNNPYNTN